MQRLFYSIFLTILNVLPAHSHNLILRCPHKTIPFQVELAKTQSYQEKGLMYRASLPENEGMLFLYPHPQPVAMWMKNTLISLDILFCDKKGHILAIYEKAKPLSLDVIGPVNGVSQVLEIKGDVIQNHGITTACTLELNP